jgi:hypothetical protein
MKPNNDQLLKWELERERFHIEDRFPPNEKRPERHIFDILGRILQKDNSETAVLPETLVQRWPVIAGEQLAKHVQPSHLRDGILYLQADHPGWLAELKRLPKAQLLRKITTIPDIPKIKDIRFQLDPSIRTGRK